MKQLILLTFLVFFTVYLKAQNPQLSGVVKDTKGMPIAFASVFQANTTKGTSANAEGIFTMTLSSGEHELVVTAVGFKPKTVVVNIDESDSIDIELENEAYVLQDVIIGNQEDPAYAIIRKAIKKRPYYLEQSGPYTAHVYIKGLQRLLKAPKKFFGVDVQTAGDEMGLDSNRRGIIYLSESESDITVNPPKDFKEVMISSKVSGNNRAFSFNRASDLLSGFQAFFRE